MNIKISRTFLLILFAGIFCIADEAYAQQDSQFTQYMYNTQSINPAYAGTRDALSVFGLYRNQWVGIDGAPKTLSFSINSPVGQQGVGVGLGFESDKIGAASESRITADFSYTLAMTEDVKFSFGLKGGLSLLDLDPSKLSMFDPQDFDIAQNNYASPIIGAGFYLHTEKWYLGISSPNFLETEHYDDVVVSTATEKTHLYFVGGYVFDVNHDLQLKPSVMVKAVSGAPMAVDVSLNAWLYKRINFGAAYRFDAAVSAMAGFQINKNILIGYAYDYSTTELGRYNDGSHEIFLRFEIFQRVKSKMSPRFF